MPARRLPQKPYRIPVVTRGGGRQVMGLEVGVDVRLAYLAGIAAAPRRECLRALHLPTPGRLAALAGVEVEPVPDFCW